jgi:hypothetical protein
MSDKNNFIITLEDSTVNIEIDGGVSIFDVNIETDPEFNIDMTPGGRGYSAYEVALQNDFVGTEEEWLASLRGPKGEPGTYLNKWIDYVTGYLIMPVMIFDSTNYQVFQYEYETPMTLYRKISKISFDDEFYDSYVGGVLSNLIAKKKI